jgi:hypothetical protein
MRIMLFDFFAISRLFNLTTWTPPRDLPECPGVYLWFGATGNFLGVGKTDDLRRRMVEHASPSEPNLLIRLLRPCYICFPTPTEQQAAYWEGRIFDNWVAATGRYPATNFKPPPTSAINNPLLWLLRGWKGPVKQTFA